MNEKTEVRVTVSTVLLPVIGITSGGDYETCIFWPTMSEVTERYSSLDEAKAGHKKWVAKLQNGFGIESWRD